MCKPTGSTANFYGSKSMGLATAVAAACLSITGPALAAEFSVNRMPASTAAARVGQAFDANIYIAPGLNRQKPVTFNLPDNSIVGARTSAVTYLAHQLDASKQTILIVGKSNGTAWRAPAALDTTASVVFTSRQLPASAVLHQIAYVDNALIELDTPLSGLVTLSSLSMPVTQAAEELAVQTHTSLDVAYQLLPRSNALASNTPGTVIGYTKNGMAIKSDMVLTGSHGYVRRVSRFAHRRTPSSIIITSEAPSTTTTTAPAPVEGTPPGTLIGPGQTPPQIYSITPNTWGSPLFYSPNSYYPYPYLNGYWPAPYTFGNGGLTILPSGPSGGPTVIVP